MAYSEPALGFGTGWSSARLKPVHLLMPGNTRRTLAHGLLLLVDGTISPRVVEPDGLS